MCELGAHLAFTPERAARERDRAYEASAKNWQKPSRSGESEGKLPSLLLPRSACGFRSGGALGRTPRSRSVCIAPAARSASLVSVGFARRSRRRRRHRCRCVLRRERSAVSRGDTFSLHRVALSALALSVRWRCGASLGEGVNPSAAQ